VEDPEEEFRRWRDEQATLSENGANPRAAVGRE